MMELLVKFARDTLKIYAPKQITIGFVGQPSVGKSRTVNGLAGKVVAQVRVTAGCTKHLQTCFIEYFDPSTSDETNRSVLLCDCPGLVFAVRGVPRPLQIVTGVFPLGRVREFYSPLRILVETLDFDMKQVSGLAKPQLLKAQYPDEEFGFASPRQVLRTMAYQYGFLLKGGQPWEHKAGLWLFRKIAEGAFQYHEGVSVAAM